TVFITNGALSAVFTTLVGGSNTDIGTTLKFSVVANTNNISKIELFSNGGSLGSVLGQSNAVFNVAGTNMGLGVVPFCAIVTASGGKQYRTETKWIRLIGPEPAFLVGISRPALLSWPATAGRSYDILSSTNVTGVMNLRASVMPSNSTGLWTETNT